MNTVLAFDPGVPQRDRLLDCDRMRRVLARIRRGSTGDMPSIVRVKYQPGRTLRVVYRFHGGAGTPEIVSCRTFLPAKTRFWKFPDDRRLQGIDSLFSPAALPDGCLAGAWTKSRLAAYSPEKSVVVACGSAHGDTIGYAKKYPSLRDALSAEGIQRFVASAVAEDGPLRVPRIRGRREAAHLLFSDVAAGTPMTHLAGDWFTAAAGLLGAALGELHNLARPDHLSLRLVEPASGLMSAAATISRVRPRLARSASDLASALENSAPPRAASVLLHGDVHLKNAFVHGRAVWLIDLDQAAVGAPAVDIGSVLALFRSRALSGSNARDEAEAVASAFLEGYARVRSLPAAADINWHTAAALLTERAVRAISRMRRPLLSRLDLLLADARRLARRGGES
jgi:Ser/Thr protein kinase RdoA (MazF antagonist)